MLCTSQLSVTYSFGETEKNPEKRMQNTSKDAQNDDFKVLSAEKVVNNNFKTQYNSVRNNSSIENEETRFHPKVKYQTRYKRISIPLIQV